MSKAVKVDLNRAGVRKLMKDPGIGEHMRKRAQKIATAAGPGHEVTVSYAGDRGRATVRTATHAARRDEAENRRLTRAIRAGGGQV